MSEADRSRRRLGERPEEVSVDLQKLKLKNFRKHTCESTVIVKHNDCNQ